MTCQPYSGPLAAQPLLPAPCPENRELPPWGTHMISVKLSFKDLLATLFMGTWLIIGWAHVQDNLTANDHSIISLSMYTAGTFAAV